MKVRASIKKRSADCKIVRRKGRLYVINKRTPGLSSARDNSEACGVWTPFNKQKIKNNMARIAGIDLPKNKRGEIGLTYIFGIGPSTAKYILTKAGINVDKKVNQWNDEELNSIRNIITNEFKVEGALRSEVQMNIKRLLDIACYRGLRHRKGLPVRGQRTRTNSRTRKGKRRTVAGKKKAPKK